jgi:hypothetical protein
VLRTAVEPPGVFVPEGVLDAKASLEADKALTLR